MLAFLSYIAVLQFSFEKVAPFSGNRLVGDRNHRVIFVCSKAIVVGNSIVQ